MRQDRVGAAMTRGGMYRLECCPQGRWELAQMRPRDLAGDVLRYSGYLEHVGWSIDNRVCSKRRQRFEEWTSITTRLCRS